jgi:alpha-galactosidase
VVRGQWGRCRDEGERRVCVKAARAGWASWRDAQGNIHADNVTFPHGLSYLASYAHSVGQKFGTYTCAGTETCAGRPGSLNYEVNDANSYASWGVDYAKVDWVRAVPLLTPR